MGFGHAIPQHILSDGHPGYEHHTPIVSSKDETASIDDTSALWISDLWEKIVAGCFGHTRRYYPATKKADRFRFPPLAPQIAKNARK